MLNYVLSAILAAHNPYHWNMTCSDWVQRKYEIMLDDKLDFRAKRFLIGYLRTKVKGKCDQDLAWKEK